ncbi:NUDIX domain-containing protein [Telmatobacter bradus]|uniref:NUDIX domain-containing protein n=1 Tax=Telmatobacter bradus TaxID=474953 RepID=UPI003B429E98
MGRSSAAGPTRLGVNLLRKRERSTVLIEEKQQATIATLSSREVYRNHWMRVHEDQILRSNGKPGIYGVVEKDESAIILPIDGDRIWLVEQYRYAIKQRALELPQGGWEMEISDPEELARGELKEELGLQAETMTYLGALWIAYGFCRQKQHVFLATQLSETAKDPDPEEHDLEVCSMSIAEFEDKILDGTIMDQCTVSAWGLYLLWKRRQEQ